MMSLTKQRLTTYLCLLVVLIALVPPLEALLDLNKGTHSPAGMFLSGWFSTLSLCLSAFALHQLQKPGIGSTSANLTLFVIVILFIYHNLSEYSTDFNRLLLQDLTLHDPTAHHHEIPLTTAISFLLLSSSLFIGKIKNNLLLLWPLPLIGILFTQSLTEVISALLTVTSGREPLSLFVADISLPSSFALLILSIAYTNLIPFKETNRTTIFLCTLTPACIALWLGIILKNSMELSNYPSSLPNYALIICLFIGIALATVVFLALSIHKNSLELQIQKKTLEWELKKEAAFLEHAPTGVLIANNSGTIEYTNGFLDSMFGYSTGELEGHPIDTLIPKEHRLSHTQKFESYKKMPQPRLIDQKDELMGLHKEGYHLSLDIILAPITVYENHQHFMAIIRDISVEREQQKIIRKALREKESLIEEITQTRASMEASEKLASIGQLAAGVAHEINNPMAFINANCTLMKDYLETFSNAFNELKKHAEADNYQQACKDIISDSHLNHVQEEFSAVLSETVEGISRVRTIIDDLRHFSRKSGYSIRESVDLNDAFGHTINLARNEVKDRIKIINEFNPLPLYECDISRLNQVLLNLIMNAIQAIPEDKTGEVKVQTKSEENNIIISITDNGTGISPDVLPTIFEPFFTTKPIGQGTGMGLSICYGIIQDHGGDISATSTENEGSCFTITLPIPAQDESQITG